MLEMNWNGDFKMKTEIENGTGFQNETHTPFQNENELVIWIENENELENELKMKNRFENENHFQNENENELRFQNELQSQNELKMNSQNELENQSQNELKALQDYNERFKRENCIELLWEHFREQQKLKPIIKSFSKKDINGGFITSQSYETTHNEFYVEKTWITEPTKKMIDLSITKVKGE